MQCIGGQGHLCRAFVEVKNAGILSNGLCYINAQMKKLLSQGRSRKTYADITVKHSMGIVKQSFSCEQSILLTWWWKGEIDAFVYDPGKKL